MIGGEAERREEVRVNGVTTKHKKLKPSLSPPCPLSSLSSSILDKVAIKVLEKTRLDVQANRLMAREITSMESLQHPNVLRLYEVLETHSRLYLVLEFAGGGDLQTRISNEGKMSDDQSKIAFGQILSAIKHMVRIESVNVFDQDPIMFFFFFLQNFIMQGNLTYSIR